MPPFTSSLLLRSLLVSEASIHSNAELVRPSIRGNRLENVLYQPAVAEKQRAHGRQLLAINQGHLVKEKIMENDHFFQPRPTAVTTKTSWFSRMKDSFAQALIGLLLIIFSIPVLWLNEKRNAMMESLISMGQAECNSVSAAKPNVEQRGCLVHISGGKVKATQSVADKRFPKAEIKTGCLRLSSDVEVYQWEEHEETKEEEKLGGSKETTTIFTYTKVWSSIKHNSSDFQDSSMTNYFPDGLEVGWTCSNCDCVNYGDSYRLSEGLVEQCNSWQDASKLLPKTLASNGWMNSFTLSSDGKYYFRRGGKVSNEPEIGDCRVTFQYVPECEATIMALQDDNSSQCKEEDLGKEHFLPYRLIDRGLCGSISENQKQQSLVKKGRMSKGDLAANETCGSGPLYMCCLPCNLVAMCCGGALTPEIYHLWEGADLSKDECFTNIKFSNTATTWLLRFLGWVMMFAGLYSVFSPVITLLSVIPFLKTLGSYAIWGFCFIVTLVISFAIMGLAYLIYHPLVGVMYLTVAALICAAPQIYAAIAAA